MPIKRKLRRLAIFAASLCTVAAAHAQSMRYDGHRALRVSIPDQAALSQVLEVGGLLSCRVGVGTVDVHIAPDRMAQFEALDLDFVVLHDNIQTLIDAERATMEAVAADRGASWFASYKTYAEYDAYVDALVALNPAIASRFSVGFSLEGREIFGIRITGPGSGKPQVALNGCQHAREWIAPAITIYTADQLIRGYGVDSDVTAIVDSVEFHIIPIVNPDGYVYSHTSQRLWRKNRRNNGSNFGVDLNRNWTTNWGGIGSSGSTGSETYRGPSAESEPETVALRQYLETLTNFRGHLDIHSYTQAFLGPWAYSTTISPPRATELIHVHNQMADEMFAVNGVAYQAGLGTDVILSPASGVCPDWVTENTTALAWTLESRDTGAFGFELPANQIIPTGEETFAAIKVLAQHVTRTLEFQFPGGLPGTAEPDTPLVISTEVGVWNLEKYLNGSGTLWYRTGSSGPFTSQALTGSFPTLNGTLPGAPCGASIEYYFEAQSQSGATVLSPVDAPASVYAVTVADTAIALQDDFETDMGWSVSGDATDGQWSRGTPIGGGDRGDPPTDADGSGQCWLTDNVDGNSDVDGGTTILTSPVIDASGGGVLSYQYWADDGTGVFSDDSLAVDIATNAAGTNWVRVRTYNTPTAAWQSDSIDIDAELAPTATLRVRFSAADLGSASLIEAGVDDLRLVQTQPCPMTCTGDVTGDNMVNFDDLNAVLAAWGTSDPSGDADNSGTVDFDDLNIVLGAWGADCTP